MEAHHARLPLTMPAPLVVHKISSTCTVTKRIPYSLMKIHKAIISATTVDTTVVDTKNHFRCENEF